MLNLDKYSWASPLLVVYKLSRKIKLDGMLKAIILPKAYQQQINALDNEPV